MHKQTVAPFKYHVGISSLAQIATREDRVCVLNMLGGEFERRHPDRPCLFRRQRRFWHLARARRSNVGDARAAPSRSTIMCARGSTPATGSIAASSTCRPPARVTASPN